jgi:NADPH:quinone reductase
LRAAWYERQGPPSETLVVGEMADVYPGPGEVRIAVSVSGLSPGDVKKRTGWQGSQMAYPRVIPHSDGTGTIDAVGEGVDETRVGQSVWCYGAQSYRPFGTAAQFVVVPSELAVALPEVGSDSANRELAEQAACLGIAGITGYRAIFADGSVDGLTVLVHGAAGGVGSVATQMAVRDRATVIAVIRPAQSQRAEQLGARHVFSSEDPELSAAIRMVAPDGVDRIAEVDFSDHIDLDAEVIAIGGVISAYYSSDDRPSLPYWKLGFADTTLRLLGSDDFAPAVKAHAARELTAALLDGSLRSVIAERVPLADIVHAHELVERGVDGRVLVMIDDDTTFGGDGPHD